MYWTFSWARILNVQDIIKERTKETNSNIVYSFHHHRLVLANIHSILAYDVPGTEDVGLPTKFRFIVGPALQPIAGSMPVNRLRRWPNTNLSPGLLYTLRKHVAFNQYCFNVAHTLRRRPVLETALGDCTVFSDCCIMLVTL